MKLQKLVLMQSPTYTIVRFGILQLSDTKRPDYKARSCTTTQFGRIISCASIQRCSTRSRVRRNTRVDQMRYEFCHIFKFSSASSARLLYFLVPQIDSLLQVTPYFRSQTCRQISSLQSVLHFKRSKNISYCVGA